MRQQTHKGGSGAALPCGRQQGLGVLPLAAANDLVSAEVANLSHLADCLNDTGNVVPHERHLDLGFFIFNSSQ